jgi:hypothetical protein
VEAVTKLEWYEGTSEVMVLDGEHSLVALRDNGTLGIGATGLTEREIADAFAIYHEHTDPKLPVACRYTGNRLGIGEYSWAITQESIEAFEQILTWLHWKLEQQKEPDGG